MVENVEIFPIQNQSDLMGSVTINQIGISSKIIKRIDGITATILGYDVIFHGYVWFQRFPSFMGQNGNHLPCEPQGPPRPSPIPRPARKTGAWLRNSLIIYDMYVIT